MMFLLHLMLGISIGQTADREERPLKLPQHPGFCGAFPKRWVIWSFNLLPFGCPGNNGQQTL